MTLIAKEGTLSVKGGTLVGLTPKADGIAAIEINPNGEDIYVTYKNAAPGGVHYLGLVQLDTANPGGVARVPTKLDDPKIELIATSITYDDEGNATTIPRYIYATRVMRKAYPNAPQPDETVVNGTDLKVRYALSESIYAKDKAGVGNSGVNIIASVAAGTYTVGGVPNPGGGGAELVTNNSIRPYPKVLANWSWPGRTKITGSTFTVRCVAFASHPRLQRPVRSVTFIATDGTHTVSQTILAPDKATGMGDEAAVIEFIAEFDSTPFTQGAEVTCNFIARGWVGDSAAHVDTSTGTALSPNKRPLVLLCDKTGAYGHSFAVVSTTGNDAVAGGSGLPGIGTGVINESALPPAFLTPAAAANALKSYNNTNFGRNDKGGSTIYFDEGDFLIYGAAVTADVSTPKTWLTLRKLPSKNRDLIRITGTTGAKAACLLERVVDISITSTSHASGLFDNNTANSQFWVDGCRINTPTNNHPTFYRHSIWFATRNLCEAFATGFKQFSTTNAPCAITRGNKNVGVKMAFSYGYVFIGNNWDNIDPANNMVSDSVIGGAVPFPQPYIVAFNKWKGALTGAGPIEARAGALVDTHGFAIIQNLAENTSSSAVNALFALANDGSTGSPVENALIWHNTTVGQRVNYAYNDIGTVPTVRLGWNVLNNCWDDGNIKSDTFTHPVNGQQAGRTGNWGPYFGCNASGNLNAKSTVGAKHNFGWEFPGLNSDQAVNDSALIANAVVTPIERTVSYPTFTNRKSATNSDGSPGANGVGGGDYRPASGSPLIGLPIVAALPYDLAGNARSAITDTSGAYCAA